MPTSDSALCSIIIPAYNAEQFLRQCVNSALEQTHQEIEVIIVDDGSSDTTWAIARELESQDRRVRGVRQKNKGAAAARNAGFALARGEYIALLDSDDLWRPEKLERQIARLRQTAADLAYCSYGLINVGGESIKRPYIVPAEATFERLLVENFFSCSTVVLKSSIAKQNAMDSRFYHEDYVYWLNLLRQGAKAVGCVEVLAEYRLRSQSRSYDKKRSARERWKIYREYLGFDWLKSAGYFSRYAVGGLLKYR